MPIVKPKPSTGTGSVDLTPTNDRITALEESIGEIRVYTSTAETWPSTLKPGEPIQYLSSSGNLTTLTISGLPTTLTAIWISGRKQAVATSVVVKDIRRATARILDNQLIIECSYTEANTIWSTQTTASGVYSSAVQGLPNMREALRRWRFRVQFVLAAQTTAAQFLTDAQTTPLANYTGPNGVAIATEPTLDLLRLTPFGSTEVYSSATLDSARVIPAGTYVSWIVGTELYLMQTSQLPVSNASKVINPQWFDTEFNPPARYDRSFKRTEMTSLSLEYKRQDGTVKSVSLTDFVTGFANSGFWNGAIDPNGVTRFVSTGFGTDTIVVSFNGAGDKLTLAAIVGSNFLQIRKVTVNGQPVDWLPIYDPIPTGDSVAANAAAIATLQSKRTSNPTLSNIPVNTTTSTFYSPTSAGVTRTGGVTRPPATVTDFCTYDGNWDSEVELPLAARAGQVLTVRNEATLVYSLRALNTDMAGPINVTSNRSLHFVSNADGVWQWVAAPYAVRQTPQWLTAGNRGTWVTYGTISVSVTDSGNASMRIRSASGTIIVNTTTSNSWDSQVSNVGVTINTLSTFLVGGTGWTYNNVENMQETYITDRTNNRTYYVRMIVQSNHNNQRFFCYEL